MKKVLNKLKTLIYMRDGNFTKDGIQIYTRLEALEGLIYE